MEMMRHLAMGLHAIAKPLLDARYLLPVSLQRHVSGIPRISILVKGLGPRLRLYIDRGFIGTASAK